MTFLLKYSVTHYMRFEHQNKERYSLKAYASLTQPNHLHNSFKFYSKLNKIYSSWSLRLVTNSEIIMKIIRVSQNRLPSLIVRKEKGKETKGFHSGVYLLPHNSLFGYGDIKNNSDCLLFIFDKALKYFEMIIINDLKNQRTKLVSSLEEGLFDAQINALRANACLIL